MTDIMGCNMDEVVLPEGTTAIMVSRTRPNVGEGDVVEVIAVKPNGLERLAVVGGKATVSIPLWIGQADRIELNWYTGQQLTAALEFGEAFGRYLEWKAREDYEAALLENAEREGE